MKPQKSRINWRSQLMGMLFAGPYLIGLLVFLLLPLAMRRIHPCLTDLHAFGSAQPII